MQFGIPGCKNIVLQRTTIADAIAVRRDLHRHPELSWHEERTANKVCAFLDARKIAHRRNVATTGVVAEIPGKVPSPVVALRADMDALLVREETGLSFASKFDGVMHACGHDAHTAILLGAAAELAAGETPPLPVRLIFQPAEETGEGAQAMIDAGALECVSMIFGGHVDRHFAAGEIAVTEGPVNASSDAFKIEIFGPGGHAARPHETVDAVVVGALLVMALQTIVSREVNPAHPSVVSVGKFLAGSAGNVIANHARLEGSIRAQEQDVRERLHAAVRRIATSVGQLHGAEVKTEISEGTPPLINLPPALTIARRAAEIAVGKDHIEELRIANMGGEDFAYYLQHVPGCYVRIGAQAPGKESYPAHSSKFDINEDSIRHGIAYFCAAAWVAGQAILDDEVAIPLVDKTTAHERSPSCT